MAMQVSRETLRDFGYSIFSPASIDAGDFFVSEMALKEETPFVAIGRQHGKATSDPISAPALPISVEYLLVEGKENSLYRRVGGESFIPCLTLPKADGTVWGKHTREDLLPIESITEAIDYAERLVRPSHCEAVGFLLGLKLLDEASDEEPRFRLAEDETEDIDSWLADLAWSFELRKEWQALSLPGKKELQKIVMAWQPYRFLTKAQGEGVFSRLAALLFCEVRGKFSLGDDLLGLIEALLSDGQETVCIAGLDAISLLDIPLKGAKRAAVIGDCHPLVEQLGQRLFQSFECVGRDFLRMAQRDRWSKLVCTPPFVKISDDQLLEKFELADRGRGRRSSRTEAEILWLEQSQRLLTENGLLVILLTEGFLSNASSRFAREWVQEHFQIDSIFSLPPSTFQPATGIKTSLLCLRKMAQPPAEYQVFMAELDDMDLDAPAAVTQAYRRASQVEAELA
jgi:hypothetical protein